MSLNTKAVLETDCVPVSCKDREMKEEGMKKRVKTEEITNS